MATSVQQQPLGWYRGEDWYQFFQPESAADVTGWAWAFTVAAAPGLDPVLTRTTAAGGVTTVDAAAGRVRVGVPAATTAGLAAGSYVWDLWRTDSGSAVRYAGGTLQVREPVRPPA